MLVRLTHHHPVPSGAMSYAAPDPDLCVWDDEPDRHDWPTNRGCVLEQQLRGFNEAVADGDLDLVGEIAEAVDGFMSALRADMIRFGHPD